MQRKAGYGPMCKGVLVLVHMATCAFAVEPEKLRRVNPAAWGDDHVGKPLPAYMTGDECLFCHRELGATWGDNRHQLSMRPAGPDDPAFAKLRELGEVAANTQYFLGSGRLIRFLRRSADYGKLEMLTTSFARQDDELKHRDSPAWDQKTFADRCAGCHTTAVDPETRSFSALSLDCFTCHGDVPLDHTEDKSLVLLSDANNNSREVISICGQCHLRGGKSKSSGLPYPNTFVAGDNLFRDFQVDLSDAAINALPRIDQHVHRNARDVVVSDRTATTCLTCHDVHGQGSEKHQSLESVAICSSCHEPGTNNSQLRTALIPRNRLRMYSHVCDY